MPLDLIYMTAAYSNAVLVAILPHVADFAKKLDLPLPQPITVEMVTAFRPMPIKGYIGGGVNVSSNYLFAFSMGAVDTFRSSDNVFYDDDPAVNWPKYAYGKDNMTTNDAIKLARDTLQKVGYDPKVLGCDVPPRSFTGPTDTKDGHHVPHCQMRWQRYANVETKEQQDDNDIVSMEINMEKKTVTGISIISKKVWRDQPKVSVEPVLESDFKKQQFGPMFKRSNAPPRLP
jgi:hypothetical protein